MGIFSTIHLTKDQLIDHIRDRVNNLESMTNPRLEEILESIVQHRGYDYRDPVHEDEVIPNPIDEPFYYNNFSIIEQ